MNFLPAGLRTLGCRPPTATAPSITSALTQASPSRFGERKDGYIPRIHAAGFSGIADITWGDAHRPRTHARLSAGRRSDDTSRRLSGIASPAIPRVGHGSARLCSTGLTTAARFEPTDPHYLQVRALILVVQMKAADLLRDNLNAASVWRR